MPLSSGYRGVRFADVRSWHGQEVRIPSQVLSAPTADDLILAGHWVNALPVHLERNVPLQTLCGLSAPSDGIVAHYGDGSAKVVGIGGQTVNVDGMIKVIRAAYATGLATPTGIFCMRDGSRVCATFALKGPKNGLLSHLAILDDYASKLVFQSGATCVDPLCDNTVASAMATDGHGWARIRHTASFDANVAILAERIGEAIKSGDKVRLVFEDSKALVASKEARAKAFNVLFPEAPADATKQLTTRCNGKRDEMKASLREAINVRGNVPGSIQTFWNAATWLVNHEVGGAPRRSRGCELESELTGTRAERTQEILEQIQILMADGSTKEVSRSVAVSDFGVPVSQVLGCSVMDLDVSPTGGE